MTVQSVQEENICITQSPSHYFHHLWKVNADGESALNSKTHCLHFLCLGYCLCSYLPHSCPFIRAIVNCVPEEVIATHRGLAIIKCCRCCVLVWCSCFHTRLHYSYNEGGWVTLIIHRCIFFNDASA